MFLIAGKCAMLILSGSNKAVQKCCPPNMAIKPIEPKQDVLIHLYRLCRASSHLENALHPTNRDAYLGFVIKREVDLVVFVWNHDN